MDAALDVYDHKPKPNNPNNKLSFTKCSAIEMISFFAEPVQIRQWTVEEVFLSGDSHSHVDEVTFLYQSIYNLFKQICHIELLLIDASQQQLMSNNNGTVCNLHVQADASIVATELSNHIEIVNSQQLAINNPTILDEAFAVCSRNAEGAQQALLDKQQTAQSSNKCSLQHNGEYKTRDKAIDRIIKKLQIGNRLSQNDIDNSGLTELHLAVARNDVTKIEQLLRNGDIDVDAKASAKFLSVTPLLLAVAFEFYWGIQHLLEQCADVDVKDENNDGILEYARKTRWANVLTDADLRQLKRAINELAPALKLTCASDELLVGSILKRINKSEFS